MTAWFQQRFAPAAGTFLCDAQNIADGQVREFRFGGESPFAFRMFIYNDQGTFRAFRNSCPHFDVPLNHTPDELFSPDGRYFVCMTHYAQFDKHNGMCVSGPCTGESLESIPLQRDGERLLIGAD
jgi:nitrite reductase/ring-hydroxylating ferredoxin subunit